MGTAHSGEVVGPEAADAYAALLALRDSAQTEANAASARQQAAKDALDRATNQCEKAASERLLALTRLKNLNGALAYLTSAHKGDQS